jgi:acetyltransferase-like isoleucine patch superfamily enzyme
LPFLDDKSLKSLGFKKLGKNVKISDKASIYNPEQMIIGDESRIDDFCVISGKVVIGKNVHIAVFCNVAGGEAGVTIEDFAGLAYGCHVFTQSDDYSGLNLTNPTVPDEFKSEIKRPVYIKRHSIVGVSSVIFPGVTLEEGSSVGAMSLVTKSTREWSIYFGIPAKRLKSRKTDLLELENIYISKKNEK